MLQLATDLRFLKEPLFPVLHFLVRFKQHFDRYVASENDIPSFPNRSHASSGDLAKESITRISSVIESTLRVRCDGRLGRPIRVQWRRVSPLAYLSTVLHAPVK